MTVEEKRRGCSNGENEPKEDQFPVGMRVLAVDDDRSCLRMLEALLRRCQYHVTTTTQAVTALKMLRENKNKYDLIISDVHMPDMDGFKLLELVGLEMDLPVISKQQTRLRVYPLSHNGPIFLLGILVLSADGDTQFVMKGITHGACDYLLKPVRLEELKNIWQHVVRKKKPDCRDNNFENSANPPVGGQGLTAGHDDQNANLNRKRKDQDEDEDYDSQENGEENEDPSAQKKPRVVWSVDLHLKFVAAVNQLGLDKAVPKKILDLMNVERLTRENVASHLQKYRLYLKRLSSDSMATLGSKDPSYLRMYDGIGNFHSLTRSGQLPNAQLGSFPPSGVIGRLNTPASLGVRGLPSGLIQHGYTQNSLHSINDLSKLQSVISAGNRNVNLIKGMPTSLELDQLQQNRSISRVGELSTAIDDPSHFPLASGYLSAGTAVRNSSNPFRNVSNNALLLQGHSQQTQNQGGFGIQSSISIPSVNPGTFQTGVGVSSQLPDHGRCNENWQGDVPLNGFPSNTLPMSDPFSHVSLPPRNFKENFSPLASHIRNNQLDFSSASVVAPSLQDSRRDALNQAAPAGNDMRHDNLKVSNFGATSIAVGQKISYNMQQQREDNKQDYTHNVNIMVNSPNLSLPMNGGLNSHVQNLGQDKAGCNTKRDSTLISHSYNGSPFTMHHNEASMSMRGDYNLDRSKSQSGLLTDSSGSLEDLMNAMVKQENNEILLMDGGMGCNVYPVRTCI